MKKYLGNFRLVNYRDRLDIIADILNVASKEAKKTQIMYQANLSYKVLQRYLNEIVTASLIRFEDEKQCYMLTEKGHEYLDAYKEYSRFSKTMEKRLNDFSTKRKVLENLCPTKQTENSSESAVENSSSGEI
jgi:predicted transcriptional regulator